MAKRSRLKKKRSKKKAQATPTTVPSLTAWREVNRLQIAALLGVHPDTVTDYARSGMPVTTPGGAGREGVYDAVDCLAWWRERQGKNALEAAKTRQAEAQAKLNELKLSVQRAEFVPREHVMLEGQGYTKAWAAMVQSFPRQLVQAGVLLRDREAEALALLRSLLTEIAAWRTLADTATAAKKGTAA